jgi:hypothetical protein
MKKWSRRHTLPFWTHWWTSTEQSSNFESGGEEALGVGKGGIREGPTSRAEVPVPKASSVDELSDLKRRRRT